MSGSETSLDRALEVILRRDRTVVFVALLIVVALSWSYLLAGAGMGMSAWEMTHMTDGVLAGNAADHAMPRAGGSMTGIPGAMQMDRTGAWDAGYASLMFFMWWIMMIAMMVPSAARTILLFAAVSRRRRQQGTPGVSAVIFAAGYVAVWAGFSALATGLQWMLSAMEWLSGMMALTWRPLCGWMLIAAGLYQFTPLKKACLVHCRSPLHFLSTRWREGSAGALGMGVEHGAFCVGCCWFLMLLLFAGGVMNLWWIVGLAVFVLLEKLAPPGRAVSAIAGVVLVLAGVLVLSSPGQIPH